MLIVQVISTCMNTTAIKHNIQIIIAFKALPKLPATFLFILPPCFIYTSASWIDHSPLVPSAFPPLCLCSGGFPHQEDSPYFLNWSRPSSNAILSKKSSWSSQPETFPSSSTHQSTLSTLLQTPHFIPYYVHLCIPFSIPTVPCSYKSIIFFKWIHLPKSLRFDFTLIRKLIKVLVVSKSIRLMY